MAKGIRLKDADTEELYYPLTVSDLVVDHETGESVKHRLDTIFDSPTITSPTIEGGSINRASIKGANIGDSNFTGDILNSSIYGSLVSGCDLFATTLKGATTILDSDDNVRLEMGESELSITDPTILGGSIKDSSLETTTLNESTFVSGIIHESTIQLSNIVGSTFKGGSIEDVNKVSINGGTSNQFLKADGSLDEKSYVFRNVDGSISISDNEIFKTDTDNLTIAFSNSNGEGYAFEYDPEKLNISGVDHLSVNNREVAYKDELDQVVGEDNNSKYVQRNSRGLVAMNGNNDGFWYDAKGNQFDVKFFSVDEEKPENFNELHFISNGGNDGSLNIYSNQKTLKFNFDRVALAKDYDTSKVVDEKIKAATPTKVSQLDNDKGYITSLEDYVKKDEIPTKVSNLENDKAYQTKEDVDRIIKKVVGNAPEALDTLEEIAEKLQSGDDAINAILTVKADKSEIPTKLSQLDNDPGYLTEHQSLKEYYTKTESNDKFQPKGNYLTEHQSLAEYAKKSEVPTKTSQLTNDSGFLTNASVNLDSYYTKTESDGKFQPKGNYLTEHQSLANYYTKTESDGKYIAKGTDKTKILLSDGSTINYYKATSITTATSDDGIITPLGVKNWTESKFQPKGNYITEHQSLGDYAKKVEIPTKVSQLSNDKGYLTEHQSLANYYTKSESDGKFLPLTNYNANDILNKLKSVDGSGSGLDADLLRGVGTSSNGDPNTIPVINENGMLTLQGIKTNPVVGEISEEGWYNIYSSDGIGYGDNESIILSISSEYGSYLFAISIVYRGSHNVSIVQLNGEYDVNVIPEIEVVGGYSKKNVIRIKYAPTNTLSTKKVYISGIGRGTFNAPFPESATSSSSKSFKFSTTKGFKTTSNLQELTNEDLNELEGLAYNSITNFYGALRNTCKNKPTDYHFFLTVSKYDGVEFQTYYDSEGIVWIRRKSYSVWTGWEQLATLSSTVEKAKAVVEQVLTNEDLNNLNWEVNTIYFGEEGNSCINKPTGVDAFTLCNYSAGKSSFVRMQVLYPNSKDGSEMFMRVFAKRTSNSFEWKPWRKVRTNDDKMELPIIPYTLEYKEEMSGNGYTGGSTTRITLPTEKYYSNVNHFILRLTVSGLKNDNVTLDLPVYYDKGVGSVVIPISCGVYKAHEQATFLMGSIEFVAYGTGSLALGTTILKEV